MVLVHGAWHGGWCWSRVEPLLRAKGHTVYSPTLTGLCERAHLISPSVNLTTHIEDVVGEIRYKELTNIVLCGHSYGGMVITGVAERMADRICSIVFLDAFVPEDGQSVQDIAGIPAPGEISPPPVNLPGMVNDADAPWVVRQATPQPGATFTERLKVTGALARIPKRTYIRATGGRSPLFDAAYARLRQDAAWTTREIACRHDAMLDRPAELTKMLIAAA